MNEPWTSSNEATQSVDTKKQESILVPRSTTMATSSTSPSSSFLAPWYSKKNPSSSTINLLSPVNCEHASADIATISSSASPRDNKRSRQVLSDIAARVSAVSLGSRRHSTITFPWDTTDFQPVKVRQNTSHLKCDLEECAQLHVKQSLCSELSDGLPSLGSAEHSNGNCRPCVFFHKARGCHMMKNCAFCHLCTKENMVEKKKILKEQINQKKCAVRETNVVSKHSQQQECELSKIKPRQSLALEKSTPSGFLYQSIELPQAAVLGCKWRSRSNDSERQDMFVNGIPGLLGDKDKLASNPFSANEERGLSSLSSYEAHLGGTCTPCMFGHKFVGCKKGDLCEFCHFCDAEKCRSQKILKAKLARMAKRNKLTRKEQ